MVYHIFIRFKKCRPKIKADMYTRKRCRSW